MIDGIVLVMSLVLSDGTTITPKPIPLEESECEQTAERVRHIYSSGKDVEIFKSGCYKIVNGEVFNTTNCKGTK